MESKKYSANATLRHFEYLTKFVYILTGKNFWFQGFELPGNFEKIYESVSKFHEAILITFLIATPFARLTQYNLNEEQSTDLLLKSVCSIYIYTIYAFTAYRTEPIKELLFSLMEMLKWLYNYETVERRMINKSYMYLAACTVVACCSFINFGVEGAVKALTSNATFTTIIPIWPDIEDRSHFASFVRILIYIIWLFLVIRGMAVSALVICISICLGYQFAKISEYFLSLNNIFEGEGSQPEKEIKYEKAVKFGIKMHNITMKCVNQLQSSCKVAYGGQLIMHSSVLVITLVRTMNSERSFEAMAPNLLMVAGILMSSSLYICSAADITVEAESLPTAMFHSGWQNCMRLSSVRVRKLITIAMAQAQQPVVIKGLVFFEMTYALYVTIVKSSYSVFSVIY